MSGKSLKAVELGYHLPADNTSKNKTYICKSCGVGGFIWMWRSPGENMQWRLFTKNGILHNCKEDSLKTKSGVSSQPLPTTPSTSVVIKKTEVWNPEPQIRSIKL